jgi:hypothetical protein
MYVCVCVHACVHVSVGLLSPSSCHLPFPFPCLPVCLAPACSPLLLFFMNGAIAGFLLTEGGGGRREGGPTRQLATEGRHYAFSLCLLGWVSHST